MASSLLAHELSHELVARAYGQQLQWTGMAWSCPTCTADALRPIAISGLATNIISSEILLRLDQTPYDRGWLSFDIISEAQYSLGSGGDLNNFTTDEARLMSTLSVIHAASVSQRGKFIYLTRNGIFFKIFYDL